MTAGDHQIMNAGSGVGVSVRHVLDTVQAITGHPITVDNRPPKDEPSVLVADSSLLRSRLHWTPEHSAIEQIVSDAWDALPIAA